jgi:hypothetical protein
VGDRVTGSVHRMLRITLPTLLTVCLGSCAKDPPPPMARDLPAGDARAAFSRRVQERFPIGTRQQALLAELQREGFTMKKAGTTRDAQFQSSATYTAYPMFCKATWTVSWSAEEGRIAATAGDYQLLCL